MTNWKYHFFWATVVAVSMTLGACAQKKDDNNLGRPPLPAGAKAGTDTPKTSTLPVVVAGKPATVIVSDITRNTNNISLSITINGSRNNIAVNKNQAEFTSYFVASEYVVTYTTKCSDNLCNVFYITAWISNASLGINEAQLGIIANLNGETILGDKSQLSLSIEGEKNLISSLVMFSELDVQAYGSEI